MCLTGYGLLLWACEETSLLDAVRIFPFLLFPLFSFFWFQVVNKNKIQKQQTGVIMVNNKIQMCFKVTVPQHCEQRPSCVIVPLDATVYTHGAGLLTSLSDVIRGTLSPPLPLSAMCFVQI